MVMLDPQGLVTSWSEGARRLKGYDEAEIVGQSMARFYTPEDITSGKPQQMMDLARRDSRCEDEGWRVRKDGTRFYADVVLTAMLDPSGQFIGFSKITRDITERQAAEEKMQQVQDHLQASHDLLDRLSQHLPGMVFQYRLFPDGHASLPYASDGIREIYEVTPAQVAEDATPVFAHLHPDDVSQITTSIQASALTLQPWEAEYWVCLPVKGVRWVAGQAKPEKLADGSTLWHGFITDITQRKQLEASMQLAASVFTHAREAIMVTDAEGTIVEVNATFSRITGYTREEAVGQNPRILKSDRQNGSDYAAMWTSLIEKGHWYGEVWNRRKNGEIYAEMQTISAVRDAQNKTLNYVALFTDITPMKAHQQALEHIAHYDALTHLPNRVLMADRLQQAIALSQRHGRSLGVVYLDLDGFKAVNDQHGHGVGDELLIALSQRMKTALREGDTLARIGGDEFVAVLADLERPQDCESVLTRLLQAAADPVTVGEKVLNVSASIGVTPYPQDGVDADLLLRHADQAMLYQAKQGGQEPLSPVRCGSQRLAELLAAHPEVPPDRLELEVLETSALEDMAQVATLMQACRDLGVTFALDDFGTGYSSLTYLKHLPVELFKIDQSFVRDMLDDPDDLAIVQAVVGLATAFHRKVIAEGVETIAHGELLLSLGCELAQGYGIARPMPAAALPDWAAAWQSDAAWMS